MRNTLSLLVVCGSAVIGAQAGSKNVAQNYDTPSYIQFSAPRFEVTDTETNAVVTVVRTGDYRKTASVEYATVEGSAEVNVDFQACGGTLTFASGQSYKTITIPVTRQSATPKTFQVELTQAALDTIITTPTAEVEIQPLPPALAITLKNGAPTVSWPDAGLPYKLEAQLDGIWSSVPVTPVLNNDEWTADISAVGPVAFFRLTLDN